ncbi:hypothetical protein AALP_AA4G242900 [Arabis alpina]|uniref:Pentatricopeptide repeat-containing protein n=1 Tax=Arabis alpina TaxID=50452 RepID=A0A087H5D0_ARAAL|nr:hypothetical protein AALP_AA4G242900 [Arabis alpina]
MFHLRLRSSNAISAPIRLIFSNNLSSLPNSSAASVQYPIPRDPSSRPLPPHKEFMWKLDWCASHIHTRVMMMIKLSNLDAAADQSRLTVLAARSRSSSSSIATTTRTCDAIIGAMCSAGRYSDAFDYFHYFFNVSNLKPNVSCCNHIIGALCHQGRVDEAVQFYRHLLTESSFTPNEETYIFLVKGLVDVRRIKEAEDLIIEVMSSEADWCSII